MIRVLMDWALGERAIVVGAALLLIVAGLYSFHELDIEAYPDPVQPGIEITTQPLGYSAEEVEKLATIPLESVWRECATSRQYEPSPSLVYPTLNYTSAGTATTTGIGLRRLTG